MNLIRNFHFTFEAWKTLMFPHLYYNQNNLEFVRYGEEYDLEWQYLDRSTFFHLLNREITSSAIQFYTL